MRTKLPREFTRLYQKIAGVLQTLKATPTALAIVFKASVPLSLLVSALSMFSGLIPLIELWVNKLIIDAVVLAAQAPSTQGIEQVVFLLGIDIGIRISAHALSAFDGYIQVILKARVSLVTHRRLCEHALTLDLQTFEDPHFSDVLSRAKEETRRPLEVFQAALHLIQNLITLGSLLVLFALFKWYIVPIVFLVAIPNMLVQMIYSKKSYLIRFNRTQKQRLSDYLISLILDKRLVKEIKLFGLGPYFLDRGFLFREQFYDQDRELEKRKQQRLFTASFASALTLFGGAAYFTIQAAYGRITLGDMALFTGALRRCLSNISSMLTLVGLLYEKNTQIKNLFDFFEFRPRILIKRRATPLPEHTIERIEFCNVSFRYPDTHQWALQNINLSIQKGESLGLVGHNGAGKTTLVKLLTRLYDPTEGAILVNGIDIRQLSLPDLQNRIGVIFQDFGRYAATVRENIGYGHIESLTDMNIIAKSARNAGADAFIQTFKNGYDHMLGRVFDDSTDLSDGQWQLVALARAFMRDAELMILDEPTASVDAVMEHKLYLKFQELMRNRTTLLISHRLSAIKLVDRIVVLRNGKLIETGRHDELLSSNGLYTEMFEMQAQAYR